MILDILDMELKFILKLKHIITDIKELNCGKLSTSSTMLDPPSGHFS